MRNIKLTIEYDGTGYCGWQIQAAKAKGQRRRPKTIQETLQKALKKIVRHNVKLVASGRTDSGVHALNQIANFKTTSLIPAKNIQNALNGLLPGDITILKAVEVSLEFHSRFSTKAKTYRYLILNRRHPSALLRNRTYFTSFELNISRMRRAAKLLLGRHNFKPFCASGSSVENTIRTIKKLTINNDRVSSIISIEISADGFLYNMVRSIVGTLIEISRGKNKPEFIEKILRSKNRSLAGPTVAAKGLYLARVKY